MKNFKFLNNTVGWVIFAIAAFVYLSTMEPTASLWDCPEFIASAYKLEVGHPPGAPLFMMLGRLFTFFAFSPAHVALTVNAFSALCSAFTILFLFWSITYLARKIVNKNIKEYSLGDTIAILGSGVIGALAYTFSDTFWFSAVEGEVYAASSLLTAIVFWVALKWEEEADQASSTRWLLLLAYITGLSIGIHLLNLLVIPAIVFIYYFKKYPVTLKGIALTLVISGLLLAIVLWGIIPGIPKLGSYFDLLFVNSFNLPINSGLLVYAILLSAVLIYGIYYTKKKKQVVLNTILLAFSLCVLGYGSYAMIVIRSSSNPSMDQNKPDNIYSLISFLNRDQYGTRPLLTGPYFSAPEFDSDIDLTYARAGNKYVKENIKQTLKYKHTALFPRMYSSEPRHIQIYRMYAKNMKQVKNSDGEMVSVPSFFDNLNYFFDYQVRHMYWRYFMWNFAGRQNDIQGVIGDPVNGNWISGIKFIDEARLGSTDNAPLYLKENKANNKYYLLPLILGLIGLLFHLFKRKKDFTVVLLLFFFTGIAIILYLNQPPVEPRERDYTYAGSFYAFSIWIGLGVMAIWYFLRDKVDSKVAAIIAVVVGLPIPTIMAVENWDDHDRSGSYFATDLGHNFLKSCDKEALLYSFADNDTFPLWYNQEVEGVRKDVRVANMMYLSADWFYIQMLRRIYDSPPIKSSGTIEQIQAGRRSFVFVNDRIGSPVHMKEAMDFVFNDKNRVKTQAGIDASYIPATTLRHSIDKNEVIAKGLVSAKDSLAISPYFEIKLTGGSIHGNKLALLDFLSNNYPNRPIQYCISADYDSYKGLENNLRMVGLTRKLVPDDVRITGNIDIEQTFNLLVNEFKYRGLKDSTTYYSETARRMEGYYRMVFFPLAENLIRNNDFDRLNILMTTFKNNFNNLSIPYNNNTLPLISLYYQAKMKDEASNLADLLYSEYLSEIKYYKAMQEQNNIDFSDYVQASVNGMSGLLGYLRLFDSGNPLIAEIDGTLKSDLLTK